MSLIDCTLEANASGHQQGIVGALIGTLVGFADAGRTPLVTYPGQLGTAPLAGRAASDVHGAHIGGQVVLVFEGGNPRLPIVIGCLRITEWPESATHKVEMDVDGQRLVVTAQEQLVLRCGKASITLTRTGKVLIEGAYISSRSGGVNRLKGASVQIN